MLNRTLILALAAVVFVAVGVATSFFELILLGAVAAIAALVIAVRRQPGREAEGR